MTKEFLISLFVNEKSVESVFILLVTFINVSITFRLGLWLLKSKIPHHLYFFYSICLTISNIAVRVLIPIKITPLIFILLMALIYTLICKGNWLKAFGWPCILVLLNSIGDLLIAGICVIDKDFSLFLHNPYGLGLASLSESLAPAIILFTKKETLFPAEWNSREMLINGLICFLEVFIIMVCIVNFYAGDMELMDFLLLVGVSVLNWVLYCSNTSNLNKKHTRERDLWQQQLEEVKKKRDSKPNISPADLDRLRYFWTMFDCEANEIMRKN